LKKGEADRKGDEVSGTISLAGGPGWCVEKKIQQKLYPFAGRPPSEGSREIKRTNN